MTSRMRITIPIALLALALLVPAASARAATERTISVTADATLKVPNDSASLGFAVSRERRTRGAALRAVASGLRGVIAIVQATPGVGPGDITTGRISVRKTFRGTRPVYRASEGVGVILHQPEKAGELVSAAIGAGATGVSGPNFFVGDSEAAFTGALTAAFDKAKVRATALATQAGGTLGPTLSIDEGEGPSITPEFDAKSAPTPTCGTSTTEPTAPTVPTKPTATKRCATAPPPVKPGTSTVTATVHVVFALQ
jgi:uncharacterized protein YggE